MSDHHHHHGVETPEHTTQNGDSCCSDTPTSSGHHMMSVSVVYIFNFYNFKILLNFSFRWHSILVLKKLYCLIGGNFRLPVV